LKYVLHVVGPPDVTLFYSTVLTYAIGRVFWLLDSGFALMPCSDFFLQCQTLPTELKIGLMGPVRFPFGFWAILSTTWFLVSPSRPKSGRYYGFTVPNVHRSLSISSVSHRSLPGFTLKNTRAHTTGKHAIPLGIYVGVRLQIWGTFWVDVYRNKRLRQHGC